MIGGRRVITGLEVGTTKTCAVILEVQEEETGRGRILGVGLAPTEGVRSDEVTDLEATTGSIREALREAEMMAELEVREAYVGLGARHARISESSGVVAVEEEEITRVDLERVHEVGRAVVVPPDRELMHAVPQGYSVDGREGIRAPIGMAGTRLEAEVCLVTASRQACDDLRRAVDRAGYGVEELVLEPLASSLAVLTDHDRETGVALVEVGGCSTDVAVFFQDRIRHVGSLAWGGRTVTNDIVKGLGVPVEQAEQLKREHGVARTEGLDPSERIEVRGPSRGTTRNVSRELLAHIVEQRLDEIFGLVYEQLEERSLLDRLTAGIVLSGGGVSLPATVELAQGVFNRPVRLGEPARDLSGFSDAVRRPRFATAVGLALYGRMREGRGDPFGAGRVLTRVTDWIKDFF